jgi:hypothetical protein
MSFFRYFFSTLNRIAFRNWPYDFGVAEQNRKRKAKNKYDYKKNAFVSDFKFLAEDEILAIRNSETL